MHSENISPADNQQERLIKIGWIIGFVDGEGCFSINFVKQPNRQETNRIRKGYKTGYQVSHEFAVTQGQRSIRCLKEIKAFFGVGNIYINRRHDNHKEDLFRYTVTKREDLLNVIIPFFEQYYLKTAKQIDFLRFAECVRLMQKDTHKTNQGLINIVKITEKMNHKKSRENLIRILRDYTPNSNDQNIVREDIVHSAWRHAVNGRNARFFTNFKFVM